MGNRTCSRNKGFVDSTYLTDTGLVSNDKVYSEKGGDGCVGSVSVCVGLACENGGLKTAVISTHCVGAD